MVTMVRQVRQCNKYTACITTFKSTEFSTFLKLSAEVNIHALYIKKHLVQISARTQDV